MKKKLAVIGASYLQLPLVKKAKEMGIEVHCFAWNEGAVCSEVADFFYPISIIEKEKILKVCKCIGIDGICTIASDVAAPTVAFVANNMGLIGNEYEASIRANNKYLMRETFTKAGVPCPKYIMVSDETRSVLECDNAFDALKFPLIVKPSDRSGSLGVTRVNSLSELSSAIELAIDKSFNKQAMVEEFVEGREISVEFISYNGIHYPLQITDKITTEYPHFVELEHHQPSSLSKEMYKKIYEITNKALNALGITNGASHSEYRIAEDGRVVTMEIGGRMGGDFIGSDLVRLSTGYDFVKGVIEVALGMFTKPIISLRKYSGVYFLCKEAEYIKHIIENKENHPEIIKAEITDKNINSVKCSADRSGYMIYSSDKYIRY